MDGLLRAMSLALSDVSESLRYEFPAVYAQVDAILADPERDQGEQQFKGATTFADDWYQRHIRECLWCGDEFWLESPSRPQTTCSNSCGHYFLGWQRRRAAA